MSQIRRCDICGGPLAGRDFIQAKLRWDDWEHDGGGGGSVDIGECCMERPIGDLVAALQRRRDERIAEEVERVRAARREHELAIRARQQLPPGVSPIRPAEDETRVAESAPEVRRGRA